MTLREQFGQKILALRVEAGMSTETLGRLCDVTASRIQRLERGEQAPSLDLVEVLAANLAVSVESLFCVNADRKFKRPIVSEHGVILVPFAKDGTCFHPGLRKKTTKLFGVGTKTLMAFPESFDDALDYLRSMETAKWLRPSSNGNWGIVSAVTWAPLPEEALWQPKVPT
jgi:DNA-binding XRE family transcriptional regulator